MLACVAQERQRQYDEAQQRGGLIDDRWLRRVAAAGTIEEAERIVRIITSGSLLAEVEAAAGRMFGLSACSRSSKKRIRST